MRRRLLLFDVDGTLLSPGRPGLESFTRALREVFGTAGEVESYRFEGKLDPVIVTELMRAAGVPDETIAARRDDALRLYLDLLEAAFAEQRPLLKPGVPELLESLSPETHVVRALLTGNVERGARIKLTAAGLWHHFSFGVWGDDAPLRTGLGPVALARARERTGTEFSGRDCVVVGDSPSDVACGRALGARVVAVATGRTTAAELAAAGADVVLPDLADPERAREALLS